MAHSWQLPTQLYHCYLMPTHLQGPCTEEAQAQRERRPKYREEVQAQREEAQVQIERRPKYREEAQVQRERRRPKYREEVQAQREERRRPKCKERGGPSTGRKSKRRERGGGPSANREEAQVQRERKGGGPSAKREEEAQVQGGGPSAEREEEAQGGDPSREEEWGIDYPGTHFICDPANLTGLNQVPEQEKKKFICEMWSSNLFLKTLTQ
ncbi:hypothetical protein XELAEV_18001301mg [Xenopus laevis]|nr:hypothetical protein XELAEV_18001301mg [Xenopus laevis]